MDCIKCGSPKTRRGGGVSDVCKPCYDKLDRGTEETNKTQLNHFVQSHDKLFGAMHVFVSEIAPTLTRGEFERLCAKRPHIYEKHRAYMDAVLRRRS